MIEQINIALSKKGPGISAWVIEARRRRLTLEKRAYTSIKSGWRMNIPRSSPSEQDDIVNSLNYEDCSNWVAVTTFPDSDRLRVGSVTD